MIDLEELKRLAQAAQAEVGIVPGPKRMDFVGAANPAAVLSLIERVEEVRRVLAYVQECEGGPDLLSEAKALEWARRDDVREELEEVKSERDAYKERVALLEGK